MKKCRVENCGIELTTDNTYRSNIKNHKHICKKCHDIQGKDNHLKVRTQVLNHYGNKCVQCGETIQEFLTIDHINNDGAKHRKEMGGSGSNMYHYARRFGFPDNLQLLCQNCNFAKGVRLRKSMGKNKEGDVNRKLEVIEGYGEECICCGSKDPDSLSIDHIHGLKGEKRMKTRNFYKMLIDQNFPKENYRLLCMNCNVAHAVYGSCPHQYKGPE